MKRLFFQLLFCCLTFAQASAEPLRVGFIGSLTGFAGSYGTASLEGVRLAEEQLNTGGQRIELFVEDDQSSPKSTATAYQKLKSVNRIQALITGTWWANSIVKTVERDKIPFLSCETLYNKDFVPAPNYFSLVGDLREFITVYEPLVKQKGWKKGAIVHFVSGFAQTLAEEMKSLFSKDGRSLVKEIEYADFEMGEAATIATQIKASNAEVLYIDAQPVSISKLITRLAEQQTKGLVLLANSVASDAVRNGQLDPSVYPGEIYFSTRGAFLTREFSSKFEERYKRQPALNADLGYFAMLLIDEATKSGGDPVRAIAEGKLTAGGIQFVFDEHNVFRGVGQNLYTFKGKEIVPVQ